MTYSLADLLDDRNHQLYDELAAKVPIELQPSDDSSWGELLTDGVAVISYAPSSYPISCFTHELLHVRFDLLGMERPACRVDGTSEEQQREDEDFARDVFPYFYNQIIHQKMYPLFISMDFHAGEFLGESDAEGLKQVIRDTADLKMLRKKLGRDVPFRQFILPYLFAKSPQDNSAETERMRKDLRNISGGATYVVDNLIKKFVADSSPNVSWYLAHMFYLCGMLEVAIGKDEEHLIWAKDTAKGRPPTGGSHS